MGHSFVEINDKSFQVRVENRKLQLQRQYRKDIRRDRVKEFSRQSQLRLTRLLLNNSNRFKWFFTVTYHDNVVECNKAKGDLHQFLTRFRKACGSSVGYLWAMEFQSRGAVHYHIWFDDFTVRKFKEWEWLSYRKSVGKTFTNDTEGLEKYKFLTYLWLLTSGQLDDDKAVMAACTLLPIKTDHFVVNYAIKYAWKREQKIYDGEWSGRYWGASRRVKNDKVYYSENSKTVRVVQGWIKSAKGMKKYRGLWIGWDRELMERIKGLSKGLEKNGFPQERDEYRESDIEKEFRVRSLMGYAKWISRGLYRKEIK
jgi:hypothetical protein